MNKAILVIGEISLNIGPIHDSRIYFCPDPRDINLYSKDEKLYFYSENGWIVIDLVLWRCQFDKDLLSEQRILEIILQTDVTCINNALSCLLYCHNALMNYAISEINLPAINKTCLFGPDAPYMGDFDHSLKVLKVGEYHGGYGKALIDSEIKYIDTLDIATRMRESISLEDYIPYKKDIRILYIDQVVSVYERIPSIWKANVNPKAIQLIDVSCIPDYLIEGTIALASKTHSDIIGVDWILSNDGNWFILEGNLSPGIVNPADLKHLTTLIEKRLFSKKK